MRNCQDCGTELDHDLEEVGLCGLCIIKIMEQLPWTNLEDWHNNGT